MKLVVPFTDLRAETYRATRDWPGVRYVYVGDDDYAYGRLLREVWAEGQTICIVEHDILPWPGALEQLAGCDHDYCAFPYPWTTTVGPAMGCTKFSADFLLTYPHAVEIATRIPSNYGEPGHWKQLDVWLQAAVLRDFYGEQPHCHLPPVAHLNEAQALLDVHKDSPPVLSVRGRSHLAPGTVERIAAEIAAQDGAQR